MTPPVALLHRLQQGGRWHSGWWEFLKLPEVLDEEWISATTLSHL